MNISPMNGSKSASYAPSVPNNAVANGADREIQQLSKVKSQLQEQIQKTKESDMEQKSKQERINDLQRQMQEIDNQIKQLQSEKLSQKSNEQAPKKEANPVRTEAEKAGGGQAGDLNGLLLANLTYEKVKTLSTTNKRVEGEASSLKLEMKLDAGRGEPSAYKSNRVNELEQLSKRNTADLGETLGEVRDRLAESSEEVQAGSATIREQSEVDADKEVRSEGLGRLDAEEQVATEVLEKQHAGKGQKSIDLYI